ncbi:hypothetical protein AB1Y20_006891 [Prymnesium parvum]|uniref:Uncharacterized protein n=1 Tax=Prymnesium parvum TaxID=97485 RepID=A0AB34J218_PRYPA
MDTASAQAIQAAFRGHHARAVQRSRAAWLADLARNPASSVLRERPPATPSNPRPAPLIGVNVDKVRRAALSAAPRAGPARAARRAREEAARRAKEAAPAQARRLEKLKPELPEEARIARARARQKEVVEIKAVETQAQKEAREYMLRFVLEPMLNDACALGEGLIKARERQRLFERRLLNKPVCTACLFGQGRVLAERSPTLAFLSRDGIALIGSTAELSQLSLHLAPLPQLPLSPLVTSKLKLCTNAPLHSIYADTGSARVFALHTDGWLLIWGARDGELRHNMRLLEQACEAGESASTRFLEVTSTSTRVLASCAAYFYSTSKRKQQYQHTPLQQHRLRHTTFKYTMTHECALAPPRPLLSGGISELVLFNKTWLDGSVHLLEPGAGESLYQVWPHPNAPQPEAVAPFVDPLRTTPARRELHLAASLLFVGEANVLLSAFDGEAAIRVHDVTSGRRVAELGGHLDAPPLLRQLPHLSLVASAGQCAADCSIRLWRIRLTESSRLDLACDRVLLGHKMPLTDVAFLPDSRLLVSCSSDCSIRFWDVDASPHLLTAPEGGSHVRVGPGLFSALKPEWTTSNPPYVNCLTLQTKDVPIAIAPLCDWVGPEGLLVLTRQAGGRPGSVLNLWGVTRTSLQVEAVHFDEPILGEQFSQISGLAAKDWRDALHRVQVRDTGYTQLMDAERKQRADLSARVSELLARAALMRPSLSSSLAEDAVKEIFSLALMAARSLEKVIGADGEESEVQLTKMTLTQCFNFCNSHRLLCKPIESLASLRRWHEELKSFKPSLAAREQSSGAPARAVDAAGGGSLAVVDEFVFSRLLNDLDPISRQL